MASSTRVALVTGANQGIGFEIVRQLCKQFDGKVLLAARNTERGQEAVQQLQDEGLDPRLLTLDVNSMESIRSAKDEVEKKFGRLDVLINNAGIFLKRSVTKLPLSETAKMTIETNYHGVLSVTNTFLPLLQPNCRIVNVSSGLGNLSRVNKQWKDRILSPDLTIEGLTAIMDQFVEDAKSPDYASKGWPPAEEIGQTPYRVSKIGVTRLTQLQAKALASDPSRTGILVNAVCPGWVRTNIGTAAASRSTTEGADTPVYLALLSPGTTQPNGEFLRDKKLAEWHN